MGEADKVPILEEGIVGYIQRAIGEIALFTKGQGVHYRAPFPSICTHILVPDLSGTIDVWISLPCQGVEIPVGGIPVCGRIFSSLPGELTQNSLNVIHPQQCSQPISTPYFYTE